MNSEKRKPLIDDFERMKSVIVVPYDDTWPQKFEAEAKKISDILGDNCIEVHHIGSTAIPGIYAKPIIDIPIAI